MDENLNKDIDENKDTVEVNDGIENDENIKVGEEKSEQVLEEKEGTASKEEKAADEQEEGTAQEADGDGKEKGTADGVGEAGNVNSGRSYSADYEPPSYTPNFTVWESAPAEEEKKPKNKKGMSTGALVAICAATLILSIFFGTLAGAIAGGGLTLDLGADEKQLVNIIRSDREIIVEEIPGNTGYDNLSVAQVAALVGESVVEITTAQKQSFGSYIQSGAGSGVIFEQSGITGYIVTNYHVIDGADDITVRIKKDDSYVDYKAEYLAGDMREDLAVLTVTTQPDHTLTGVVIADSDKLQVGEEVVAIGNPLGTLGGTVTNGIISALDREIVVGDSPMTLLQTNAAINPGNSGGGLFNMAGELVGIVNAKQSSSGIEGLGFAIPANMAVKGFEDLCEHGYIRGRSGIGITLKTGYTGSMYNPTEVLYVEDGGNSGLQSGDILVKVNGRDISTLSDCYAALKNVEVGTTVDIEVNRNGRSMTVSVRTVEYKPANN